MGKSTIEIGDRYIKVDAQNIIWVVSMLVNVADRIPHVRLVQEGTTKRNITLSALALQDTSIYKKIEANKP
jgi:hypothetical protein